MEAARKALHSINSLQLFANIEVMPKADEQVEGGIIVEIKLRELDPLQAELNTEWSIAPGDTGKPSLVSCWLISALFLPFVLFLKPQKYLKSMNLENPQKSLKSLELSKS